MRIITQCKTITPRCTRYYHDGKRVAADKYEWDEICAYRVDCIHTKRKGNTEHHYRTVYLP